MHDAIKKYVESQNKLSLKYALADGFDVDPTYEKYEEDLAYCKKNMPDLFEPYTELTLLINDKSQWNEAYWLKLKKDIITNFSEKRFNHMREVAKYVFRSKVSRLENERKANAASSQNVSAKSASPVNKKIQQDSGNLKTSPQQVTKPAQKSPEAQNTIHQPEVSESSEESGISYGEPRMIKVSTGKSFEPNEERNDSGEPLKKVLGIVLAIAAVIIIVICVLSVKNNPKAINASKMGGYSQQIETEIPY